MIKSAQNKNENEGESLLESVYRMSKETTQNECNLKLMQKVLELNNKIFYHQVEQQCLNDKINQLTSQIQIRVESQRLLSLQISIHQSDANTYKQKNKVLEQLIESMREQKKNIIKEFQDSQNKLRAIIAAKQRDYTTSIQIKEEQTKQKQEQIKGQLQRIMKELKQEKQNNQLLIRKNDEAEKSFQAYYTMYEELKNLVISKLSQNKEQQNPDFTQIINNICFKMQELQFEKKKIQEFITIQQGNNHYREYSLIQRVKINFLNSEEKALRKQKNLENVEIFLNNLLKSEGLQNDFSYGQALLQKIKERFIDYTAKLHQQKKNILVNIQKCKTKDQEIKKINEMASQLKQQNQRIKKQWNQALQELGKQKKVGENYKKDYQQLKSQIEDKESQMLKMSKISQNFQFQSTRKVNEIQNLNKKLRDIELKKQNEINNERNTREKLEEKLKQMESEINAELERFEQAQKKHKKQIEQIEKSNKNGEERINKIREQCQLQKRKIKNEFDEYKKKYVDLEDNNKSITKMIEEMKKNLEIKNLQIQQIQQQLCTIVNQARLERNQPTKNVQSYKQALSALNKLLKDSGAKVGSPLFKIPSLIEKCQANIEWIKGIIDQYCGCGTKFESKFIGKIDESFKDITKLLNNQSLIPNLLLIIQTSKGSIFCIFITKFTTTIKDRDPVVLFSGEKKLKYPSEQKKNHDTRPSIINPQGALQFGKKQMAITKMLEIKLNIIPAGYFGNVDIQSMYGIQTAAEPVIVQKMQIHQIVF